VKDDVRWTGNDEISEMLGVTTGACTSCGGPARVPEDVAAVRQHEGKLTPLIVCPKCQPDFEDRLREKMARMEWLLDTEPEEMGVIAHAVANIQMAVMKIATVWESTGHEDLADAQADLEQAVRYLTGEEEPS
jgi:hypothetical protein